ncbi:Methyl-accepting chemotaxis protein (MCP) signalling domain-containing protein [Clostridium sp. DSM 8431]|uniref:methyl-accepting chemotaxis protein n=1 Tax=Clostridium sp. DSM 8431 TaxID=1761781 RepID=UPI0008E1C8E9|nr:methyl-accepting chemotaxis protein [Clostridium sp. DSM 8431]SFU39545.1 Methyl-accepting chemotaxis protein (MCP) signalling domain-containing protein [Clostridium sp. DSM 8431]
MEGVKEKRLIESICDACPYIQLVSDSQLSIAITDKEKVIYTNYCDGVDLKLEKNQSIVDSEHIMKAIKTGEKIQRDISKDTRGIFLRHYMIPIKEEGQVVGCLVVGKVTNKKKEVEGIARNVSMSFSEISSAINNISDGVLELASMNEELLKESEKATSEAENTKEVVNFIQGISSQINLLGLNAAIEAARAGEEGRGFSIVAQEIRKLANSTSESIKEVYSVIKNISSSIANINEKVIKSNDISQNQSAALEEITASISEVNVTAKQLDDLAHDL